MKLKWIKQEHTMNTYYAESARYRFIMIAPPRTTASLWVQPVAAEWGTEPIAECTRASRRRAERTAQRFENRENAKRLV